MAKVQNNESMILSYSFHPNTNDNDSRCNGNSVSWCFMCISAYFARPNLTEMDGNRIDNKWSRSLPPRNMQQTHAKTAFVAFNLSLTPIRSIRKIALFPWRAALPRVTPTFPHVAPLVPNIGRVQAYVLLKVRRPGFQQRSGNRKRTSTSNNHS